MNHSIAYIGTYTRSMPHVQGKGAGIYTVELCNQTGALSLLRPPVEAPNSSYLCLGANSDQLYAISEIYDYQDREDGCLNVFSIEGNTLSSQQTCSSHGMGPAYISIDHSGRWLFNANYVQGNVVVYPILANGSLGTAADSITLTGKGPNETRQEAPHPHAILPSPDNRYVYVIDLGTDWITGYHFDSSTGKLTADDTLKLHVEAGTGPRHFIFHPHDDLAYCVHELTSQVSTYRWDRSSGQLAHLQTYSTLPKAYDGESHCSEIRISKNGQHIYIANRGHNSIALFSVQPNGTLKSIGYADCQGHIPRNICLSPNDQFLLIANQESNELVSIRRNSQTGELGETAARLPIPTPAYIEFI